MKSFVKRGYIYGDFIYQCHEPGAFRKTRKNDQRRKQQRPYKAKSLTYVTTSGGPIFADFGYEYIKALAKLFYGIKETKAYRAENLDVDMITAEDVLTKAVITVVA